MLDAIKHCSRIGGRSFEISATAGMASIEKELGKKIPPAGVPIRIWVIPE